MPVPAQGRPDGDVYGKRVKTQSVRRELHHQHHLNLVVVSVIMHNVTPRMLMFVTGTRGWDVSGDWEWTAVLALRSVAMNENVHAEMWRETASSVKAVSRVLHPQSLRVQEMWTAVDIFRVLLPQSLQRALGMRAESMQRSDSRRQLLVQQNVVGI